MACKQSHALVVGAGAAQTGVLAWRLPPTQAFLPAAEVGLRRIILSHRV